MITEMKIGKLLVTSASIENTGWHQKVLSWIL